MKVYGLIYTTISPDKSPWQKSGFQTVAYSQELITDSDVFEIEKRIHFPGSGVVAYKDVFFYYEFKGEVYLIILQIRDLPQETDELGRGGVFLCQGFIFPPSLWKLFPTPFALVELVKEHIFENREQVFSSPLIDWKTGNLTPIEISDEKIKNISSFFPALKSEFEWNLVFLINKLANNRGQKPALLLKGEPKKISALLDKLIAYVPDALKIYIGWDSAFDHGNLTFFPLKIAGFSKNRPLGGKPIFIDIEAESINEPSGLTEIFTNQTPFERWLYKCRDEVRDKADIEGAFALSVFLTQEKKLGSDIELRKRSCFELANSQLIEETFLKQCENLLGSQLSKYVADALPVATKLDLLIEEIPPEKLTSTIERVILENRLTPEVLKTPLPESIRGCASKKLRLILKVWDGKPLIIQDIEGLKEEEKRDLISYLFLSDLAERPWMADLLKASKDLFNKVSAFPKIRPIIERIIQKTISEDREFKEIAPLLTREAIAQGVGYEVFTQKISFLQVIEDSLKNYHLSESDIKTLLSWAKKRKPPEKDFPYIRAFLYPQQGEEIPKDILQDERMRDVLLDCFLTCHRYKPEELEGFGFKKEEIMRKKELIEEKSLLGKVKKRFKKLFDFKRKD